MRTFSAIGCLLLVGCGPLTTPMVERLPPEEQAHVESAWENMLTPPDRLDHELLLDVLISYQCHQRGVDRLQLISEKDVPNGRVVMTISFDRLQPDADQFAMAYYDLYGRELRRESYTREEINARLQSLYRPISQIEVVDENGNVRFESSEEEVAERVARQEAILAATQPAGPD